MLHAGERAQSPHMLKGTIYYLLFTIFLSFYFFISVYVSWYIFFSVVSYMYLGIFFSVSLYMYLGIFLYFRICILAPSFLQIHCLFRKHDLEFNSLILRKILNQQDNSTARTTISDLYLRPLPRAATFLATFVQAQTRTKNLINILNTGTGDKYRRRESWQIK